ncbi:unnamed protein product [Cylicocyclus nassatus]|uniref:Uncharacterized protein n=1 Tax=Cylicocyclus nassatus TaxID=53992 RepID=A0AA36GU27_CYLNA|nr:unnamed protein product [Cylicocyclus nassatus]
MRITSSVLGLTGQIRAKFVGRIHQRTQWVPEPTGRDISHVKAILEEAGITDYDPRVVHLLLDLLYTTTSGLLTEAKAISQHCGKMVIDETDVQIAVEMSGLLCDGKPNRADLLKMACERNAQPLPQIRHNFGLKLPNDRFCLLQPNVEWRGSDRTTADLLANNAPLTVGQPPAHAIGVRRNRTANNFQKHKAQSWVRTLGI